MKEDVLHAFKRLQHHIRTGMSIEYAIDHVVAELEEQIEREEEEERILNEEFDRNKT